jgi:hypothetical protein
MSQDSDAAAPGEDTQPETGSPPGEAVGDSPGTSASEPKRVGRPIGAKTGARAEREAREAERAARSERAKKAAATRKAKLTAATAAGEPVAAEEKGPEPLSKDLNEITPARDRRKGSARRMGQKGPALADMVSTGVMPLVAGLKKFTKVDLNKTTGPLFMHVETGSVELVQDCPASAILCVTLGETAAFFSGDEEGDDDSVSTQIIVANAIMVASLIGGAMMSEDGSVQIRSPNVRELLRRQREKNKREEAAEREREDLERKANAQHATVEVNPTPPPVTNGAGHS